MRSGIDPLPFLYSVVGICIIGAVCAGPGYAQEELSTLVRIFRLDGTFGTEQRFESPSIDRPITAPVALREARVEADALGFLTRLRTKLTIANGEAEREVVEAGWRVDIYDQDHRILSHSAYLSERVMIKAASAASASATLGAVLPDRMVVVIHLTAVKFRDGTSWSSPMLCELERDLRTLKCRFR